MYLYAHIKYYIRLMHVLECRNTLCGVLSVCACISCIYKLYNNKAGDKLHNIIIEPSFMYIRIITVKQRQFIHDR